MKPKPFMAVAAVALAVASCTTPPITTPSAAFSVTLGEMCPQCPSSFPVLNLGPLPPFEVDQSQGGLAIQVPSQAQSVNISTAILNTQLRNQMKVPLTLALSLAKDDAYGTTADQLGTVSLQPGAVQTLSSPFDPSLLKNQTIHAGVVVTIGSTQDLGVTELHNTDAIQATTSATIQVKLF